MAEEFRLKWKGGCYAGYRGIGRFGTSRVELAPNVRAFVYEHEETGCWIGCVLAKHDSVWSRDDAKWDISLLDCGVDHTTIVDAKLAVERGVEKLRKMFEFPELEPRNDA